MTDAVVFETPGLMDIRAFTIMGLNVKPTTKNPIGYFGTGLKYAIAVLVRNGLRVRMYIGQTEYEFYLKTSKFRDQDFDFIMLRKRYSPLRRWTATQLPFTTQLGRNWKLWQAFRELYTNTIDEGGTIFATFAGATHSHSISDSQTKFIVVGDAFVKEYDERGKTFLLDDAGMIRNIPPHPHDITANSAVATDVEIIDRPSKHVYWRGMRVFDLPDKMQSLYTYNIHSPLELTEDRTVLHQFFMNNAIVDQVKALGESYSPIIRSIVTAKDTHWEHKLQFTDSYGSASDTFKRIVSTIHKREPRRLTPSAGYFYDAYIAPALYSRSDQDKYKDRTGVADRIVTAFNAHDWNEVDNIIHNNQEAFIDLIKAGADYFQDQIKD